MIEMRHYYSLNDYCRETFGCKLYKLSLDGGMTCPNRDGTVGTGGCVFCSPTGSGEFSEQIQGNISLQIENAKSRVEKKNKGGKYIAYFQNFTNTYAPVDYLERIFTEAINHPDIKVLSVATRPDCLDSDVVALLSRLNTIKPLWIELGLQTSDEASASYINRGYTNDVYTHAVKRLHNEHIGVVTHIIAGLPGETREQMIDSVKFACDNGTDGLKIHLLYVVKDTDLAEEYAKGTFHCLEKEEYLQLVCDMLKVIPKNVVIHRLTGDGDKKNLISPMCYANKKDVLNSLNRKIEKDNVYQGEM